MSLSLNRFSNIVQKLKGRICLKIPTQRSCMASYYTLLLCLLVAVMHGQLLHSSPSPFGSRVMLLFVFILELCGYLFIYFLISFVRLLLIMQHFEGGDKILNKFGALHTLTLSLKDVFLSPKFLIFMSFLHLHLH